MQGLAVIVQVEPAQSIHHRGCILRQQLPMDQTRENESNTDIENRGDD